MRNPIASVSIAALCCGAMAGITTPARAQSGENPVVTLRSDSKVGMKAIAMAEGDDGQRLLAVDQEGKVLAWNVEEPKDAPQLLLDLGRKPTAVAFSPKAARIAVANATGKVEIVETTPNSKRTTLPQVKEGLRLLKFLDEQELAGMT